MCSGAGLFIVSSHTWKKGGKRTDIERVDFSVVACSLECHAYKIWEGKWLVYEVDKEMYHRYVKTSSCHLQSLSVQGIPHGFGICGQWLNALHDVHLIKHNTGILGRSAVSLSLSASAVSN